MNKNLQDLASCLKEAGKIVDRLSGNDRSGISTSSSGSSGLLQAAMSSVSSTVQRARSMVQSSSKRGRFSRLNQRERLRAMPTDKSLPPNKKAKPVEKAFEFVFLNLDDEDDEDPRQDQDFDSFLLNDDSVVLRGFVTLNSLMSETDIRKALAEAIQIKFPTVAGQDLEFLKANRRKLTKPVISGEFTFKEIRLLAGQGCIYLKLKDGFQCLIQASEDKDCKDKDDKDAVAGSNPKLYDKNSEEDDLFLVSVFDRKPEEIEEVPEEMPEEKSEKKLEEEKSEKGEKKLEEEKSEKMELGHAIGKCIEACKHVSNPVEILRAMQKYLLKGRDLDPTAPNVDVSSTGDTNFMEVNRFDLLKTVFEELDDIEDLRLTVQVAFYGEIANDFGGPRREFFRLCLHEIKETYFDHGLRELLEKDYEKIGVIMALSILQNGPIPTFLSEEILEELFKDNHPSPCVASLQKGLQKLGLYEIIRKLPLFLHLMRPSQTHILTRKRLVNLLRPCFAEEGSNSRRFQLATYEKFSKYVREVASGRRFGVSLGDILQFTTGSNEEPVLGFTMPPSIQFHDAPSAATKWFFVPTANSCSQTLCLPTASLDSSLPKEDDLFEVYDHAFKNTFFGLA